MGRLKRKEQNDVPYMYCDGGGGDCGQDGLGGRSDGVCRKQASQEEGRCKWTEDFGAS